MPEVVDPANIIKNRELLYRLIIRLVDKIAPRDKIYQICGEHWT